MSSVLYTGVVAVAGIAGLAAYAGKSGSDKSLSLIPVLKFDDDDTQERYVTSTREIIHDGYEKYTKRGLAFRMRNPVDDQRPVVIMPWKYLDEVKSAPQTSLSFPLYTTQAFLLEVSGSALPSDSATHVCRIDLNKNLGELAKEMKEECIIALQNVVPSCEDWTILKPWDTFFPIISKVTGRVLVGSELGRNPEWSQLTVAHTMAIMEAAKTIRATYSRRWRWLARWFHPGSGKLPALRKRAAELLAPTYAARLAEAKSDKEKHRDGIQWLLDTPGGKRKTLQQIADEELFLHTAGIHSTGSMVISILYDLVAHQKYIPEIMEEVRKTLKEAPEWTKQSLAKLRKLDSFMTESQRMNPIGLVTVNRSTVVPYTFSDGLHFPANTMLSFPNHELNHDSDIYTDPEKFDGLRFFRMRESGDPARFHFATVSNESIGFGAGFHACPARFFVSHEIKILLVELLLRYDLKFAEGDARPQDMHHDFSVIPNPMAELLIRKKK